MYCHDEKGAREPDIRDGRGYLGMRMRCSRALDRSRGTRAGGRASMSVDGVMIEEAMAKEVSAGEILEGRCTIK